MEWIEFRSWLRLNAKLFIGTAISMAIVVACLVAGYTLHGVAWFPLERLILLSVIVAIGTGTAFWTWTMRSVPRYPNIRMEYRQHEIERAVQSEWGKALDWLRLTVEKSEECSDILIRNTRYRLRTEKQEPSVRELVLTGMHAKVCDLSRSVADLCQRGHAEAAIMLWRSIFEIQVNMAFIEKQGTEDRAIRFQDWSRMSYLKLHAPDGEELKALANKYNGWDITRDIGWTRQKNPMGVPARAREVGYGDTRQENLTPILHIYEETNAYGHNDATAIFNDLGKNHPFAKGPSATGLDMPLCLTSLSMATINDMLVRNHSDGDKDLGWHSQVVWARQSQVPLEVAMVPERLLSRFKGFYVSTEIDLGDGITTIAVPARRGSKPEDVIREFQRRHRQQPES